MIGTHTLLLASTLALAGCSLAPQTVQKLFRPDFFRFVKRTQRDSNPCSPP